MIVVIFHFLLLLNDCLFGILFCVAYFAQRAGAREQEPFIPNNL